MEVILVITICLGIVIFIRKINNSVGAGWGEAATLGIIGLIGAGIVALLGVLAVVALVFTAPIWLPLLLGLAIIAFLCKLFMTSSPRTAILSSGVEQVIVAKPAPRVALRRFKELTVIKADIRRAAEFNFTRKSTGGEDSYIVDCVGTEFFLKQSGGFGVTDLVPDQSTMRQIFHSSLEVDANSVGGAIDELIRNLNTDCAMTILTQRDGQDIKNQLPRNLS